MRRWVALFLLVFCQFSLWGEMLLVFATPLQDQKVDVLRGAQVFNSEEEALLLQDLRISTCHRWIQTVQGQHFLIHLIRGDDLGKSTQLLRGKMDEQEATAVQIRQAYQDVLGVDLRVNGLGVNLKGLTPMLQVDVEKQDGDFTKEYCFIYPILPSKQEKLLEMFRDESEYWSSQIQAIYRHRGISKQQLWIQEDEKNSFLVVYQEITGPVTEARRKYLNSKDEQFCYDRAMEFSDVTGLSYEELLPTLESLFDVEVLD